MRAAILAALAVASCAIAPVPAFAQTEQARPSNPCAEHAPEAALRSRLSLDVVLRVMRVESAGRRSAVSHKGAMGCMQIMPGTWAYLTRRYALGPDPFAPRMNMIGGALYLAELAARYGFPGAYSAYNAGPGRYERHVARGVPLPRETVAYTARMTGRAQAREIGTTREGLPSAPRWQEAGLFLTPPAPRSVEGQRADRPVQDAPAETRQPPPGLFPLARPRETP